MSRMSNFFGRIVMSYPFYIHAATSSTASQHPCRLFFAAAAVAAPFILTSNNAYAALNCTTQPTCEQLGYSKSIDANCDDYILCPFDTSYKKCITGKVDCAELGFTQDDKSEWCNKIVTCQTDSSYTLCAATENCDDFPLSKCPTGANCSSCGIGTDVSYKVDSCEEGYKLSGNTCVAKSCPSGYSTAYQSVANCGTTGSKGWILSANGFSGDKICGKCTAKTCSSHGYSTSGGTGLCKSVQVYLGNSLSSCNDCIPCEKADRPYGSSLTPTDLCKKVKTIAAIRWGMSPYKTATVTDSNGRKGVCAVWYQISCSNKSYERNYCCQNGVNVNMSNCCR